MFVLVLLWLVWRPRFSCEWRLAREFTLNLRKPRKRRKRMKWSTTVIEENVSDVTVANNWEHIVSKIDSLYDFPTHPLPVIGVAASSATGKTQLAFALEGGGHCFCLQLIDRHEFVLTFGRIPQLYNKRWSNDEAWGRHSWLHLKCTIVSVYGRMDSFERC